MEKRNKNDELQKGVAGIKKRAILLATLWFFIMTIVLLVVLSLMLIAEVPKEVVLFMGIMFMMVLAFCFLSFKDIYEKEGINKLAKRSLAAEEFTEVKMMDTLVFEKCMMMLAESYIKLLPLENPEEYRSTISDLLETAKFYARISTEKDNSIEIFVKYEAEEKMRYYKTISAVDFLNNYSIQEES